jgi:nitrite reductase/ring-hydroxylating ferredoxin subunit
VQVNGTPAWHALGIEVPQVLVATDVEGVSLIVANVDGTLLAYRNQCAACAGPLDGGALDGGALECPSCGRNYFLPQAGRSMDDERLQLQPVPLLREQEEIKVAL